MNRMSKVRTRLRLKRRGKPIADVPPVSSDGNERSWIGAMSGTVKVLGDIVSPVIDTDTIEALKEKRPREPFRNHKI